MLRKRQKFVRPIKVKKVTEAMRVREITQGN